MPTFRKSERLCSAVAIDRLFTQGYSLFKYPIKIVWLPAQFDNNHSVKVVISVSKRRFKKAVDRNRIKRLLRECFRLHKSIFDNESGRQLFLGIVYTGKELPEWKNLEPIIIELFQRLSKEYEKIAG